MPPTELEYEYSQLRYFLHIVTNQETYAAPMLEGANLQAQVSVRRLWIAGVSFTNAAQATGVELSDWKMSVSCYN